MYNQELKEKYISTVTNASKRKRVQLAFNSIEPYEKKIGKDICAMSYDEVQRVLTEVSYFRNQSRRSRMYLLTEYVEWCNENDIKGAIRAIFDVKELGLEKFRQRMVVDPGHLQTYLDCLFESEDEETIDCVNRCYYWLAFIGFEKENLEKIMCSDVDLINGIIQFENKEYVICKEGLLAFDKCATLDYFFLKHPNYEPVKQKRFDSNQLLRGTRVGVSVRNIKSVTSRRQGDRSAWRGKLRNNPSVNMDLQLNYANVQLSGLYYRMYEAEKQGMPIDFRAAALWFMGDYEYKMGKSRNTREAKVRQVQKDYEADYLRWKAAYSLPSYNI